MQRRGAVHFHVLVRLDGVNLDDPTAVIPPPAGITLDDLTQALTNAAASTGFATPTHPDRPHGWPIAWGDEGKNRYVDIRPITLTGAGEVSDGMVAGYLAKYATKSTEATGHTSTRLTADTVDQHADAEGDHIARLIDACWQLGRATHTPAPLDSRPRKRQPGIDTQSPSTAPPANPYARLRRWAHMLGYGGHFLTKARRYSVTFKLLRDTRVIFRRRQDESASGTSAVRAIDHLDAETTLVVGTLTFAGVGWHTSGDALLANTAAAMARARHDAGREELAHEAGTARWTVAPVAA